MDLDVTGNETEKCMYYQPTENAPISLTLLLINFLTLLVLAKYSWAMYCQVDITHPVFAVIFQDLLVLTVSKGIDFCIVLMQEVIQFVEFAEFSRLVVITLAVNFHQVSWLIVMSMRYHSLKFD